MNWYFNVNFVKRDFLNDYNLYHELWIYSQLTVLNF